LYKELAFFMFMVIFSGCSVFKIQNKNNINNRLSTNLGDLKNHNLTNNSFFIQNAEVELVSDNEKQSFLASVKYTKPDSFLISIRSKAGIEAARIFITEDTLLINDRINRKLYFGSALELKNKFGYNNGFLPFLFGDFILKNGNSYETVNCKDGEYIGKSDYKGLIITYIINCNSDRIKKLEIIDGIDSKPLVIEYTETKNRNEIYLYSKIHIKGFKEYKSIDVNYKKIETPYNEFIEFIPGKNYEQVRIR